MHLGYAFLAAFSLPLTQCTNANFYLKDKWIADDFFRSWNWETEDDPTHGRVNFVSQAEAISKNLSYVENNTFVMRADYSSIVNPSARGRDSVRISSQNAYGDSIVVLDLAHMPAGCATWPGFRTKSQQVQSSASGVIDIIEGINLYEVNQATLHTTSGCQMPPDSQRLQSGTALSTICDTAINNNTGCGVSFHKSDPSFGKPFDMRRGGYYVMVRSRVLGIRVYFWPRDNSIDVPQEIRECRSGGGSLYPDPSWGIPAADFPMSPGLCNYDEHFDAHRVIFSLTFCGDWAGNNWPSSGCGSDTCENYVNNNPSSFSEAYWAVNSLRVYTPASPY